MPSFKKPQTTGNAPLKEREVTAGGFQKPAQVDKKPMELLEKTGIDQELRINDLHVNEELIGQPLLMRKYTRELSRLKKKVKAITNQLEMKESAIKIMLSNDGKGRKVAEIESMVISDVDVQKLRIERYDAEEMQDEYEGIVKSIAQRYEMLKELCANLRKEMV